MNKRKAIEVHYQLLSIGLVHKDVPGPPQGEIFKKIIESVLVINFCLQLDTP